MQEARDRNSNKGLGKGRLLDCILSCYCFFFLFLPPLLLLPVRDHFPWVAPHTVGWNFPYQSPIKKTPHSFYCRLFSIGVFFFRRLQLCQVDKKKKEKNSTQNKLKLCARKTFEIVFSEVMTTMSVALLKVLRH